MIDPLPPDATDGHIAHRGYYQAMVEAGGVEMPWENLSDGEQQLWEAAAAAVLAPKVEPEEAK
jgi:hypothetical protein